MCVGLGLGFEGSMVSGFQGLAFQGLGLFRAVGGRSGLKVRGSGLTGCVIRGRAVGLETPCAMHWHCCVVVCLLAPTV